MARKGLVALLLARLATLRFPTLAWMTAVAFVADLFVPDMIPAADEVLLGLLTALFFSWRKRRSEPAAEPGREGEGEARGAIAPRAGGEGGAS